FYVYYCFRYFNCTNLRLIYNDDIKKVLNFSMWDLYGNFSVAVRTQGVAIIQNLVFGVAINAAIGIANQVQAAVNNFAANILVASKPQVIQKYSREDYDGMISLITKSAKYSFLFLCVII